MWRPCRGGACCRGGSVCCRGGSACCRGGSACCRAEDTKREGRDPQSSDLVGAKGRDRQERARSEERARCPLCVSAALRIDATRGVFRTILHAAERDRVAPASAVVLPRRPAAASLPHARVRLRREKLPEQDGAPAPLCVCVSQVLWLAGGINSLV